MKKSKKVMALVLALSMVMASGILAFADVEGDPSVGTTDTNTATDTSVVEETNTDTDTDANTPVDEETNTDTDANTPVDEETNTDTDATDESTGGETGEETEEVCKHEDLSFVSFKLATCTEEGKSVFKCNTCGATIEQKNSDPYGHQMEVIASHAPSASAAGEYTSKCMAENCDYTEVTTIPPVTEEEKEATVNVNIYVCDVYKNGNRYDTVYPNEWPRPVEPPTIKITATVKQFDDYSLNLTQVLQEREEKELKGLLDEGITVDQLRAKECFVTSVPSPGASGEFRTLRLVENDVYNYQDQFIKGFAGKNDKVDMNVIVIPWHNFTQIYHYFERPDGKYGLRESTSKDTLINTQVEYEPLSGEDIDGYEYAGYGIGYFHNWNTLHPDQISIKDNLTDKWGLAADDKGVIRGSNINFYANNQLYIQYMYKLKAYNVDYDLAGGNVNGETEIKTQTAKRTTTVSVISDPVRSGYNFKGWTVTVDNEQIAAPEITADGKFTMPAANVTLTADWEAVPFIPPYNPPTVDPQPLPPDDPLIEPVDPQPLPPDDPLIEEEDPKQPLPEDEHLIDPTDVEKTADPDQPKTGDEAPLMALGGLFFAAAGALGVIYIRRRTENK